MNKMKWRLRKLEQRFVPQVNEEARRRVALLLARWRRFAQEHGAPVETWPPENPSAIEDGPQTLVAVLHRRRDYLAQAVRA